MLKVTKFNLVNLLLWLATGMTFGQGLVNFYNTDATLFETWPPYTPGAVTSCAGAYYFALLTAPAGVTDPGQFTFSGLYATNLGVACYRFSGGRAVPVEGWLPGTTRSFLVAGWTSSLGGPVWNPAWLEGNFSRFGWFGLSSIGTGAAGGTDGTTALFPLNLFGGPTGIQTGFYLYPALATQLTITAAAGNVIVSWPTNATGFSLQATTSLGPSAIWTTNFFTPITVDGQNTVTILVSGAQQFFRLSR